MNTSSIDCIPDENLLVSMSKSGYRFKIDGKIVTLKILKNLIKI